MNVKNADSGIPVLLQVGEEVTVRDPESQEIRKLRQHERFGRWTLMAVLRRDGSDPVIVLEDLTVKDGHIVYINEAGVLLDLPKTLEPTRVAEDSCYRGHSKEEIINAPEDILGREILEQDGDPSYEVVAACVPPIRHARSGWGETAHTFVGSRDNLEAVPFFYNGSSYNFTPVNYAPEVDEVMQQEAVWEGLVGGWLPVVRFAYPADEKRDWDMTAFGIVDPPSRNRQPVWYRLLKIDKGELAEAHYIDTYLPYPWKKEPATEGFYAGLLELHNYWSSSLEGAMEVELPEAWVADFCRHSLVLEMITRVGARPRYGATHFYSVPNQDGFQDTFNSSVNCYLEWGLFDTARSYLENYYDDFVRDDGSIDYRGPEIAQYGRMLTCLAQYYDFTADAELLIKYEQKIGGIVSILLSRRETALELSEDDPAYGMIAGWDEADTYDMPRSMFDCERPYFSNNTEAWRGFRDLGRTWVEIGEKLDRDDLVARGKRLLGEAESLRGDIDIAIERSIVTDDQGMPFLPAMAGYREIAEHWHFKGTEGSPRICACRSYSEMFHSGVLSREKVEMIQSSCASHYMLMLGVNSTQRDRLLGFTVYGQAYGLLQHDLIREFLLFYYSIIAHVYTRGTWTAFESTSLDRDEGRYGPHCIPAQLNIPAVTKWMLVFEDPLTSKIWLAKATPRAWLEHGKRISVKGAPTRWGRVSYEITSDLPDALQATVTMPNGVGAPVVLRLRVPGGRKITAVEVNGKSWDDYDADMETVNLPRDGELRVIVRYS